MGRLLASLGVVLLCACLVAPAGAGGTGAGADETRLTSATQQFDHTEFRIVVSENGSARWTFQYGKTLANESEEEQFRAFAAEFENGSDPLYEEFQTRAAGLAADGANVTGRNMSARAFDKRAHVTGIQDDLGIVEMSFTWTGFAVVADGAIRVGDVFEGGLYLGPGHRLVIEPGESLAFESVAPAPDRVAGPSIAEADSVTWQGERRFTDAHPQVVLEVDESEPTTGPTTPATTGPGGDGTTGADAGSTTAAGDGGPAGTDPPDGTDGAVSTVPWLAITAFAAVVVVGAFVLLQRAGLAFDDGDGSAGAVGADGSDGPGGGPAIGPVQSEPAVADEEMLTDEERVLGLLRENGGRMRQVNIVDETGWSKSKVSMLLSEMEEADQLTKLRVGRENIVSLPGHEPDASDSALK